MLDDPRIEQPKQLFVEGNDDARVFTSLSRYLEIQDVQIWQCGGYENIQGVLRTVIGMDDFDSVRSLAVVADADSNRNARIQSIQNTLTRARLPTPSSPLEFVSDRGIKVAYLVVPHERENGMIEDVCLDSVSDDPVMECIDRYFECIEDSSTTGPRQTWMSKARSHAFLASRERPDLRIGEAADRGIWQFEHEAFDLLKDLLKML